LSEEKEVKASKQILFMFKTYSTNSGNCIKWL
jgi:hypothetical protein